MYKFYLHFAVGTGLNPSYNRKEIAEPIGFDAANFTLQQETGRYGRDVMFSPDSFTFSSFVEIEGLTHLFSELQQVYQNRGFEGNVLFEIEVDGVSYILGQLDFTTVDTDLIKYFTCNIIQLNDEAVIKRRKEVKVDLYSDKDYNGLPITPLTPEKILIKSQPLKQVSAWKMPNEQSYQGADPPIFFNPSQQIIKSEVKDTLSPSTGFVQTTNNNSEFLQDFTIYQAATKAVDLKLNFKNGAWFSFADIGFRLYVRKGIDISNSVTISSPLMNLVESDFSLSVVIPEMLIGEKLFVYFGRQTLGADGITFTSLDVELELTSISIDSLTDGVRLIDAMKQTVKSISDLDVIAPRFDAGGEHYDQYIFKGNQIRLIQDKPFTISFEDVLKYLPEVNCDYQVNEDGTVFIGHETDFYINESAGSFPISPNNIFNVKVNERFTYNKIKYSYDKYEKGENELQNNGLFGVNTEFEMTVPNQFVENTKDIKINFVRDAYRIEKMRRDSILISDNAPTIDDEDVVILDVVDGGVITQQETILLNHAKRTGTLELINDGSFSWLLAGFYVGQVFTLTAENNTGSYIVLSIDGGVLITTWTGAIPTFSGLQLTTLIWTLQTSKVNRTNQGFAPFITPIEVADGITNLKYAAKRNLQKYWRGNIKAAGQFYPNRLVKNTFYRNGANVQAIFNSEFAFTLGRQDRDLILNTIGNPILSAFIIETEVICDFDAFWQIRQAVRNEKKHIEIINTNDILIKLHPIDLSYSIKDKLLTIKGEQRWE